MLLLHGSGKTTVLVERIINKIINEKIDIDKLLIVTFTNAAASEMRQRILEALYEKIDENPENENLQKQIILLNKANISTIHAFCLEVIKNYFYEINISSNFRIGDNQEIELLKQETLEETFEELYEKNDEKFVNLVNMYGGYRDDEDLKELVLKIYKYSQSMPFPEEWIIENVEKFNVQNEIEKDFSKTVWGKILVEDFKDEIEDCISELKKAEEKLKQEEDLQKHYCVIVDDIDRLQTLLKEKNTWDDIYEYLMNFSFDTWPKAKIENEAKEYSKNIRDSVKERIKAISKKIFIYSSKEANEDINSMYNMLDSLAMIILKFTEKYQKNKKEKNIIDFNDIEHFALKILVQKDENGKYQPTEIAKLYKNKFEEIAIDEYQDSNLVQEYILTTISKDNNIFMVGDVKQSIYKFRQARPELFLEKYDKYELSTNNEKSCEKDTKIQLFQNFRSRKNILDLTNIVFSNIMSKKLGDIDYNENEYLNCSANYEKPEENKKVAGKVELDIIDLAEEMEEAETEAEEIIEKNEIEARFVANRIKELLEDNYYVYDKKQGYRKATYKDIVILLRTTSNVASIYEKELNKLEIPVFSDTSSSYFETEEIQIVLSTLKIIDNPNNDIPLVTVLRSPIANFTDNELIEIRLNSKNTSFYEALLETLNNEEDDKLKVKIKDFFNMLEDWQEKQEYLGLDEFIWYLYESTGFYDYISSSLDGEIKIANLKLLFEKAKDYEKASFKGLYNFINYIDKISKGTGDAGAAKLIGENENVVRIMSIHKSKGLEFPVVFLSGTGKQFNLQDLNQSVLLHQDIGFGPKVIDYERKIEYNTLAKEAIRNKLLNETISEEMRLLYVALTRAKEKLIITGYDKNLEKSIKEKEEIVTNASKISITNIRKTKTYLNWLELVYLKEKEKLENILEVNFYNKANIEKTDEEEHGDNYKIIEEWIEQNCKDDNEEINKILNWEYKYEESTKIEGKASVTEIAKGSRKELKEIETKPKFLEETENLSKAEIGTLTHLIMQKLNFKEDYDKPKVINLLERLVSEKVITEKQAESIDITGIVNFTNSKIYKELKNAKSIYTEQPFYIYLTADEIYGNGIKEKILVQGIIDLYYINANNKIVLVDYKTDYVVLGKEQELINKYKRQLEIYKRAIEQALNSKVEKAYIYSVSLGKEILLD